jgi:archaellum component FlaC
MADRFFEEAKKMVNEKRLVRRVFEQLQELNTTVKLEVGNATVDINERLDSIEERLERIEKHLGVQSPK